MEEAVRWKHQGLQGNRITLRTYLGAQGMKKGDLSNFIEDAVSWHIFDRTVQEIIAENRWRPRRTGPSSTASSGRPAPNGARKERLKRPDARGARYQFLVSALIAPAGNPAPIYNRWLALARQKSARIITTRDFAALFAAHA
jgi:hypothetical protein